MSYWFRRRERYHRPASNVCPSRWMVSPPKHVLRGWPTCYDGGTDTSAGRTPLDWRYTCLLGGRTTTAVLIHTSAGRTPLGWRYTYTCLLVGHTCYDGDTSAAISWAGNTTWTALRTLRILRRSRITYTFYLGGHLYHHTLVLYLYLWGEHHLGGATRTLPTWADISFGHLFGRLCKLYGEPSQASKATWIILPWLFTGDVYQGVLWGLWAQ